MSKMPTYYDLYSAASSREFAAKSDVGWAVWRDADTNELIVNICKLKDEDLMGTREHGYPYPVAMKYDSKDESFFVCKEGWEQINGDGL